MQAALPVDAPAAPLAAGTDITPDRDPQHAGQTMVPAPVDAPEVVAAANRAGIALQALDPEDVGAYPGSAEQDDSDQQQQPDEQRAAAIGYHLRQREIGVGDWAARPSGEKD